MIRRMMRYGFRIDVDHFRELSFRLTGRMAELRADITNEIPAEALDRFLEVSGGFGETDEIPGSGEEVSDGDGSDTFNVESSAAIARLLYDTLHLDRTSGVKVKKTKGGGRFSTGKKTLEQLKREHPVVPLILEYRENSKLESTYARSMPRRARFHPRGKDCPECGRHHWSDEWRVHTKLLTTRTATGRTASKDPNLANIPTRTKLGSEIRAGFIASEGHVIAQCDLSQIELRVGADCSGDPNLIRIYRDDGDVHVDTAMRAFNKTAEEVSQGPGKMLYRAPCKNVNFSIFFMISPAGLLDLMAATYATAGAQMPDWMTVEWCEQFIEKWFTLYPGVKALLEEQESIARRFGIVWTKTGRTRRVPEVRSYHRHIQEAGIRQAVSTRIQGYAGDLLKIGTGEAGDRLENLKHYSIPTYPLMTIYDELLVETPEEHGETVLALLGEVMDNCCFDRDTGERRFAVPIKSEGRLMLRWEKD